MCGRSIDLNSVLFHGLEPKHAIQREKRSLEKLECIFQCGAILSRSGQLSQLDLNTHEFLKKYNKSDLNWNGTDYISLCKKSSKSNSGVDSDAFNNYICGNNGIGIALSENVLKMVDLKRELLMDGEFQVKDVISLDHMVAIVCGGKSVKELNSEIEFGRNMGLPDQKIKKMLPLVLEERQVEIKESIGEILCKYGYDDIPIISSRDGFEVVRFQDAIEEMGCK